MQKHTANLTRHGTLYFHPDERIIRAATMGQTQMVPGLKIAAVPETGVKAAGEPGCDFLIVGRS